MFTFKLLLPQQMYEDKIVKKKSHNLFKLNFTDTFMHNVFTIFITNIFIINK